jgi:hypothetical protein
MIDQSRLFEAGPDPFGRTWKVQFRWLQTAISIRHADTVDVKFFISSEGLPPEERVIALPRNELLKLAVNSGRKLTDPLCMRIGAAHMRHMIETSEDMDKTLVTVLPAELAGYFEQLKETTASAR